MIGAAAAYMAGLFFASFFTDPALVVITAAVAASALLIGRKYDFSVKDDIMLAVFFSAAVVVFNAYTSVKYVPAINLEGTKGSFRGVITDMQDYSGGNSLYIIEGKANDSVDIRATFYSETLEAGYGDEIVIGSCDFSKQKSDYLFDTEKYYKSNGIFLTVNRADNIDIVHSERKTFKRIIGNYRERIISDFHIALGKDSGDLLSGMVFGEKRGMDQNVKTSVYRCGIGHILAVSGLHVSVFILILMTVLKCIGINKYISFVLMEALLIFITAMANYPISAIRAGIMMNFLYAAGLFRRQNDTFNSLAGAVLLICITEPYAIYDTGFILSVAGTFGIGVFAPYMTKNMSTETIPQKIICKIAVMLCTMLCVFPFSLLFFDETSLISPITNILIVPLCSVSMVIGLIYALTGGIIDLLFIPKFVNELVLLFSDSIAHIRFTHFACSSKVIAFTLLICMILVFAAAAIFRNRRFTSVIIAASLVFLFVSSAFFQLRRYKQMILAVLGNGNNAVLVVSSGGSTDIIDLSGHHRSPSYVRKYLSVNAIDRVNALILTKRVHSEYSGYYNQLEYTAVNRYIAAGSTEVSVIGEEISYYDDDFTVYEPDYNIKCTKDNALISSKYGDVAFTSDNSHSESYNKLTVVYGKQSKKNESDINTIYLSDYNNFEIVLSEKGSYTIRRL